ncbi:MAG: polyketide synthase dehydratase domain-containing protein, partial [Planctomycetia bacterium]
FYRLAEQKGFFYGPLFRSVKRVWHGNGEALCRVELPESLRSDAGRYRLHPVLFDACLQMGCILYRDVGSQASVGMIFPGAIDRLLFKSPLGTAFWGHARVVSQRRSSYVLELRAIDDEGRVVAVLEGLRYRRVETAGDAGAIKHGSYHLAWRPKPLPASRRLVASTGPADFLPQQSALEASLRSRADAIRRRTRHPELFRASGPALADLWCLYVFEAFENLGLFLESGEAVSLAAMMDRVGVPAASAPLLERCLDTLAEAGFLRPLPEARSWRVVNLPEPVRSTASAWRSLLRRYPTLFHELTLLKHFGHSLSRMLSGEGDAESGRLSEEMADLLDQALAGAPAWSASNHVMRHAVAEMVAGVPEGRELQVLQVDAGGASLALHVLAELPRSTTRYVVADPSADVLARAEGRLLDYEGVECRMLDLGQDPLAQGLAPGQFDLLLGNDAFSGGDWRQRLRHARSLLAPGGVLMFSEPDARAPLHSLLSMLLSMARDTQDDATAPRPLPRDRAEWLDALSETGFEGAFVAADTDGATEFGRAVYVASRRVRADDATGRPMAADDGAAESPGNRSWLIVGDGGGVGRDLAEALRSRGHAVRLAGLEDVGEIVADGSGPACDGIVHLAGLDVPEGDALPLDTLRRSQSVGCHSVLHLVRSLQGLPPGTKHPRLWLVTRNAQPAGQGIARLAV